jgi:hypothetical protein
MNVMRGLNLAWTPWSLFISVVVLIVVMMLGYVSWRRRGFRRGDGVLELLRLAIVAVGCLLLNQPEFTEQYLPSEKPTVAIVCDQSPSMQTKDVVDGEAGSIASRLAAAESMSDLQTWQSLGDVLNIEIRQFGQDDGQSNLFQSLHRTLQQTERLRGIVLVSDGDWNDGPPPVEVATQLRMSGIPVFSIPVGSPTRLPDLELVSLDTPAFGVAAREDEYGSAAGRQWRRSADGNSGQANGANQRHRPVETQRDGRCDVDARVAATCGRDASRQ